MDEVDEMFREAVELEDPEVFERAFEEAEPDKEEDEPMDDDVYEPFPPAIVLPPEEERALLKAGFPDYGAALAAFVRRCLPPDALGSGWMPGSMVGPSRTYGRGGGGGGSMVSPSPSSFFPEGKYHWADDSYEHGLITVRISDEDLGRVHSHVDPRYPWRERNMKRCFVVDLNKRKLHALEIVTMDAEEEPEHGHAHATYDLTSGWTTAFKSVKWPANWNHKAPLMAAPVGDQMIEDMVLKEYPLSFSHAMKF